MAVKKKAAAKRKAAKTSKKAAAKKASPKRAATKKAATKKAPAKKVVKKKAVAKKKAAVKRPAVRKKVAAKKAAVRKAAPRKVVARKKAAVAQRELPLAAEAEAPPPADEGRAAEALAAEAQAAAPLVRGRRRVIGRAATSPAVRGEAEESAAPPAIRKRRRKLSERPERSESAAPNVIPPLPDEDDDFVPFADERPAKPAGRRTRRERSSGARAPRQRGGSSREAPEGASPAERLEGVRRGDLHISVLNDLTDEEVATLAKDSGVKARPRERRSETIYRLLNDAPRGQADSSARARRPAPVKEPVLVEGLLELHPDGYGFLRQPERNYSQHPQDVYVAAGLVKRMNLKPGHWITGQANQPRPNQHFLALQTVEEINHESPDRLKDVEPFEKLTVVYPDTRFELETGKEDIEMRVMDLFCPLGRGQRGLIVAPPRTGKTILLQKLADAIATRSPDVDIVVLLLDERPEEVTNMKRSVRGEVIASTFDKPASNHIRVAELVMEKVKRMVEYGRHVVLLLDSITRMGRAYNNATGGSGRILTGGLDAKALTKPKRFFGSARNVEDGGSLTIVATALVDTGSKMDQVIFEEFKGTGNMELILSRDMANARVWPAIDVPASGTRNEDLLMHPDELRRVTLLRRGITGQDPETVMLALREQMKKTATNAEFLMQLGN